MFPTQEEINSLTKEGEESFCAGNQVTDCYFDNGSEEKRLWIKRFNNAKYSAVLEKINAKHSD